MRPAGCAGAWKGAGRSPMPYGPAGRRLVWALIAIIALELLVITALAVTHA